MKNESGFIRPDTMILIASTFALSALFYYGTKPADESLQITAAAEEVIRIDSLQASAAPMIVSDAQPVADKPLIEKASREANSVLSRIAPIGYLALPNNSPTVVEAAPEVATSAAESSSTTSSKSQESVAATSEATVTETTSSAPEADVAAETTAGAADTDTDAVASEQIAAETSKTEAPAPVNIAAAASASTPTANSPVTRSETTPAIATPVATAPVTTTQAATAPAAAPRSWATPYGYPQQQNYRPASNAYYNPYYYAPRNR